MGEGVIFFLKGSAWPVVVKRNSIARRKETCDLGGVGQSGTHPGLEVLLLNGSFLTDFPSVDISSKKTMQCFSFIIKISCEVI